MSLPPIVCHVDVACSPEHAFSVFVDKMALWWPLHSHSCSGDKAAGVRVERRVGGQVLEHDTDGAEYPWGEVTKWDPPHAFAMTWRPGQPEELSTAVSVSFAPHGDGTRVTLEHTGWEVRTAEVHAGYVEGWPRVLGLYQDAAAAAVA